MANTPINAMTATFGAGDQTAIKMNITSDSSTALSKLIDLQLSGTSKFKVTKEGYVTATNYTGSLSGSIFLKASGFATANYLVFAPGNGKRVLAADTTGVTYDSGAKTITVPGDIYSGGNIDSTNSTTYLLTSPSTIYLGSAATTLVLGSAGAGTITNIATKRITGTSFEGKLSGSHSGSIQVKNITSEAGNKYFTFVNGLTGPRVLGADTDVYYNTSTNVLVTGGEIIAGGDINTIGDPAKLLATPATITFGEAANSITIGQNSAGSFTKFLSTEVRGKLTGSFTGSVNSVRGVFTKLSGSNVAVTGRVVATSFTGSITGSSAKFVNFTAKNLTINNSVSSNSFTGSLSGSIFIKNTTTAPGYLDIVFIGGDVLSDKQQTLNVDQAALSYDPTNKNLYVQNDIYAVNAFDVTGTSSPSLFSTPTTITLGAAATGLIIGTFTGSRFTKILSDETRGHFTGSLTGSVTGNIGVFTKVKATSLTGSVFGTRAFFNRITSSTARFTIKATAPEFTGSISGSKSFFNKISGSSIKVSKFLHSTRITSSFLSGAVSHLNTLTSSKVRITTNLNANGITGSISGSLAFLNKITSSYISIQKSLVSNQITGSIYSTDIKVSNLNAGILTGSLLSSSRALIGQLTASKVRFSNIKANTVTASISGSVFVNLNNTNNDLYVVFTPNSVGNAPLFTDGDLYYNPNTKLLTVQGSILVDNLIDSTSVTTSSLFNNVPTVQIGKNSSTIDIGRSSNNIALGTFGTKVILSGSITSSIARFRKISGSSGRILNLSGSKINYATASFGYLKSNYLTSSNSKFTNTSASKAYATQLTSSNILVKEDLIVIDDLQVTGSFTFRNPLTGSRAGGHPLYISGAGALQGYMGIMINNTKYKIPLYAWS